MARKSLKVSEITIVRADEPTHDDVGLKRIVELNGEVVRCRLARNEAQKALHRAQAELSAYITGLSKEMPLFDGTSES